MNTKMIRYILAKMMGVEALLLMLPVIVGVIYGETKGVMAFFVPIVILDPHIPVPPTVPVASIVPPVILTPQLSLLIRQ